jgi:hypothetical protein
MNIERFRILVEAYGANPARWPEAERVAALLFAEQSAEARDALQEAAAFDTLLDMAETQAASRALEDRILTTFAERPAVQRAPWFTLRWIPAAAVACSLALGLAVGAALPGLAGVSENAVDPALIALSGGEADWADMGDGI